MGLPLTSRTSLLLTHPARRNILHGVDIPRLDESATVGIRTIHPLLRAILLCLFEVVLDVDFGEVFADEGEGDRGLAAFDGEEGFVVAGDEELFFETVDAVVVGAGGEKCVLAEEFFVADVAFDPVVEGALFGGGGGGAGYGSLGIVGVGNEEGGGLVLGVR